MWFAYLNHNFGYILSEDPKLGRLPRSWARKSHPLEAFYTWFVNDDTGEELTQVVDLIFTVEAFLREVELRTFTLV